MQLIADWLIRLAGSIVLFWEISGNNVIVCT